MRAAGRILTLAAALLAAAGVAGALAVATPAVPIPQDPRSFELPAFVGHRARPHPIRGVPRVPRDRFLAPNARSNIHDDAYQTDTYVGGGPLGPRISVRSTALQSECASTAFDRRGRIVSVCVGLTNPTLRLLDPHSLATLAQLRLPPRNAGSGRIFNDFGGGGYFYLDNRDRAVIPTTSRHVYVVAETAGPGFRQVRDYDLSRVVPAGDEITSALPDFAGRIWFVSLDGVVGTIDPRTGRIRARDLHEEIENSFAVDSSGGVYVVSKRRMYRFDAGRRGGPRVTWRVGYRNSHLVKPGQVDAGSGTTPTVMGRRYVAITDNADPMDVVVYRRTRHVGGRRTVCTVPVFRRGASASDNSLIATRRSMIVENNYGYSGPLATSNGGVTAPGVERVDVDRDGRGCHVVWRSRERVPSVVSKLSLADGLVYAYTKDPNPQGIDAWYLTALDFRTGRTVFKRLAGTGLGYNDNYAPVTLGPDRTAYVGVLDGLVELRDAVR